MRGTVPDPETIAIAREPRAGLDLVLNNNVLEWLSKVSLPAIGMAGLVLGSSALLIIGEAVIWQLCYLNSSDSGGACLVS